MNTSKSLRKESKLETARAWFITSGNWLPCLLTAVGCLLLAAGAAHM
jgi:hypothetical protein